MRSVWGGVGKVKATGFVVTLLLGSPALAQVTQTDAIKTPLPQPVNSAELSLVNESLAWNAGTQVIRDPLGQPVDSTLKYGNFYAPPAYPQFVTGDAINLSGLFKWRKDAINPTMDATTGPGYIPGKCGFSAELVLLGGNCQARFGWYNVPDPASKVPPTTAEIYPLIDVPHQALHCVEGDGIAAKKDGFCPLAWDNRGPYDLSVQRWTPTVFSSGDLSQDPRYKGGLVAFAMLGDPQKCPQNKYSMYEHNQRNESGTPWVTTLIYQSKVDPNGLYIAFEDLPMSPADWKKRDTASGAGADGDFNDYVVYISRPSCPGEVDAACVGKSCPSGQTCKLGACVDSCAGVVCEGNAQCVDGGCSSPTGTAGTSGDAGAPASGGSSSTETGAAGATETGEGGAVAASGAGAAGDDSGATSSAGADARGGTTGAEAKPGSPSAKSSSCGYAAFASGHSAGFWPTLGLACGLVVLRRRRHARNTPSAC